MLISKIILNLPLKTYQRILVCDTRYNKMSEEDTIEVRQENELQALKAIFGEDIHDLRGKTVWNLWPPLNISITLTPQQGSSGLHEVHAKVDLHVVCSEKYPDVAPKILLENSRGISTTLVNDLQNQLEQKSKELTGEVMIFELAQTVQAFLHQHNKPGFKSFYEEMLTRQKEQELLVKQAKQEQKDRERQIIVNEIQHRKEILKLESKLHKGRFDADEDESFNFIRKHSNNSTDYSDVDECEHKQTTLLGFSNNGVREIQRGRCLNHAHQNCTVYTGMDITTGELVALSEWIFNFKSSTETVQLHRQISSIEQELNYLVKLKHQNLAHYVNIKKEICSEEKVVVYILREFVFGVNCSSLFLSENVPLDRDLFRHIAGGVLSALDFLHRNNVVHKEITDSCVFINDKGLIKVANYSLDQRLSDLVKQSHSSGTYSKKTDILKFGLLMLSLIKGTFSSDDEIPVTISPDLHDFLSKCLSKEEKERFTAAQLLNHSFIRFPIDRFSPQRNLEELVQIPAISPEVPVDDLKAFTRSNPTGQSRVQSEFEVMQWIGKGAFGDVLKVKNKLDGGFYAIKRIELNPKNKQLNKKITREVKLLSKLNHENVVRYYNAWIESAVIENDSTDSSKTYSSDMVRSLPKVIKPEELTFKNDIELLAPPIKDVEWSISYESKSRPGTRNSNSSDDDDSSDEDEEWGMMVNADSSDSESIEFERDSSTDISSDISQNLQPNNDVDVVDSPLSLVKEIQFLYIQMEFCEKSTLRNAIDGGLQVDIDRVWRLFREIVEGLSHIHQQGMIHRDLKPVNIFLDSNDHVKIGDFGLATTNILSKQNDSVIIGKCTQENEKPLWSNEGPTDGSMTGQVGTALYTAPELNTTKKTIYNQKVDIYSLGIIFFEMCYIPLNTQMERLKVLNGIRCEEINFPVDFNDKIYYKQQTLIRWLLNHDISQRPTSQELLQSELIPPPVLEEEKLREMFRHTLSNPQLKAYKYLVASCFAQTVTPAQDITYDMSLPAANPTKLLQIYDFAKAAVLKIFKQHGGQNLSTSLLMPKSHIYDETDSCVKLMTHSGSIISIPHDLRVPFARYIAWNSVTLLRRYTIDRVYREKKIFGFHPREFYECAFDIVTPTPGNYMADAEVLYIVNEIIEELPGLKNKNVVIRLNHTALLKAILLHCGIKEKHNDVYSILSDSKEGKVTKFQVKTHLISLGLSDNSITTLFNLVELENTLSKVVSTLQMITKKKASEASMLAKQGLQELKAIIQNAEALGVTYNIFIAPGLVYNVQQYSGMMCQFVCELKKKRRRGGMDVLAAGGRYDTMIANYRKIKEQANILNKGIRQSAVGISISLDKLAQALQEEQGNELDKLSYLDAVVCSLGSKMLLKEKSKILKMLWSAGIRCSLIEATNIEEVQEQCSEFNVAHVIILKDSEQGSVRIRSWEKDRFQEKTVLVSELTENMHRIIKQWNEGYSEQMSSSSISRSESKSSACEHTHETIIVSVLFVTSEKLSANVRKRYENQIKSQMDSTFKKLSGDVIIIGLSVETNIIRTLASYLDFESEFQYQKSVGLVVEKHQRHKKYLNEICDELYEQKCKRTQPIILLYSLSDSFYKLLL